jgi:hypothetical protein
MLHKHFHQQPTSPAQQNFFPLLNMFWDIFIHALLPIEDETREQKKNVY